jgi:hypothetical protein
MINTFNLFPFHLTARYDYEFISWVAYPGGVMNRRGKPMPTAIDFETAELRFGTMTDGPLGRSGIAKVPFGAAGGKAHWWRRR